MSIPQLDFDPYTDKALSDPFRHHDDLREAGPVFGLSRYSCYGMARYAEVQAALKDWQTFVSGRGVGLSDFSKEAPWRPPSLLLEADPPLHDRTRGLMNKVTALPGLKARQAEWNMTAKAIVEPLIGAGSFDAVAGLAEAFPLQIFPELIGLRDDGRENLIPYAMSVFNAFGPRNALLEQSSVDAAGASAWVADSCKRQFLKAKGWGADLFAAADRGECTTEEAERLVRSFLSAGVDTTVNGIAAAIQAFAENPEQWQVLRRDPSLVRKAIEEVLRYSGVAQTFFRTTSRELEVHGELLPEGSKVLLFLAAANRDPRRWNNPDKFDITRNASGHVGFGFGIHQCLGQMVARFEMEAVLSAMVESVEEIRVAGPAVRRPNNTLFALGSLPVQLIPA
ncbi:cytochrome P450 [Novosphingobium sp. 17-62-19]|uniref:cytochrome P450 n=1 Tax=Novosphingobium sp. 17-62-19 TaxID=1970406 RepID=UPI0025F79099|nr:cytochrome P450 [Novosphingobium sp. 17-62-19]HQS96082.1 cytochrome P450 [Novosphingobium sp.]